MWTKASIAWAYLIVLLIFKHFILHVYNIANYKDILVVDDNYLVSRGFLLHMGRSASALNLIIYDLKSVMEPWLID